jgi:hypothetical protein
MRSERYYVQSVGAKKNWTQREWQIYGDLPWIVRKFVDVLILIPRFLRSARQREIEIVDRRARFVEQRLLTAKRNREKP